MIYLLAKLLIKDYTKTENPVVRQSYGVLCGAVGVAFNILLFLMKLLAGFISGSVAIMADAFNNLSDAGSSIIMMVGFKMSGHKPDPKHPFGHGRIEYVTGLIVSMIIIVMGIELVKTSFDKILHPGEVLFGPSTIVILIISVFVKLYMFAYNKKVSEKINSAAMQATALDSFTDSVATSIVLLSMMVAEFTNIPIDGYCGLLVAVFILYTGFSSAKDTLDPLLGGRQDKEYIEKIEEFVMSYQNVLGVHDLLVHDYGPGRMMISLHAEVPADGDIMELHDTIDNIEKRLKEVLGCEAVIHMDPVVMDDDVTNRMKRLTGLIVKGIDERLTMHDFRMVQGPTHTNLIFDVVVPFEFKMTDQEVCAAIERSVRDLPGNHFAVINIDKPYV